MTTVKCFVKNVACQYRNTGNTCIRPVISLADNGMCSEMLKIIKMATNQCDYTIDIVNEAPQEKENE